MDDGIADRLRLALTQLGVTMSDVSKKCGLPYRSLQNYTSGKQNPGAEALVKIRGATGINTDWLLTGEGEMLNQAVQIAPRDLCIKDYRELRTKFKNFDEMFQFRDFWSMPGVKDYPEGELIAEFIDYRPGLCLLVRQFQELDPIAASNLLQGHKVECLSNLEAIRLTGALMRALTAALDAKKQH